MTRIGLAFIVLIFLISSSYILLSFHRKKECKLDIEWYRAMRDDAINEISSLKQELIIEKIKNAEKDSILVVYKENMELHSSRLQDANWRLIQLKRLIESQ